MNFMMRNFSLGMLMLMLWSSCVSPEKLMKEQVYFNEGLDTAKLNQYMMVQPVIQKDDILEIKISSRSSSTNLLFSQNFSGSSVGDGQAQSGGQNLMPEGFQVDIATGNIKLPMLGVIHAEGLTKLELEQEIVKRAREYLKEDPIVNIRYLNYRVTFLGNVSKPGSSTFTSERITFFEALGQAGGTLPGSDIKNVLLFREQNGKRTMHLINLSNGSLFDSEFYYMKQNDVVYVKPTKRQIVNTDNSSGRTFQYINIGVALLNIIIILSRL